MTSNTLTEIANSFSQLSAGIPDENYRQVIFQSLAKLFAQLAVDMAPKPGWTAATGTATRTTFVTGTVTLPTLAEHVKALIDDLIARGDLGA